MAPFWSRRSPSQPPRLTLDHARLLIAAAPMPMAVVDAAGELMAANEAWQTLFGTGQPIPGAPHPNDAAALAETLQSVLGSIPRGRLTCRWQCRNGSAPEFDTRCFRLSDNPPLAALALEDLSALRSRDGTAQALETALTMEQAAGGAMASAASEDAAWTNLLAALGESGGWDAALLWQWDEESSRLRCPLAWRAETGSGQMYVRVARELILLPGGGGPMRAAERQEVTWIEDVAVADRSLHAARADNAGVRTSVSLPVIGPEGTRGALELVSAEVRPERPELHRVLSGMVGQITGLLSRLAAEEPMRAELAHYQAIAQRSDAPVIAMDASGVIRFANVAANALFGYNDESLIGHALTDLMPERLRSFHRDGLTRYLKTHERRINWHDVELPGLHRDGHEIHVQITIEEMETPAGPIFTGYLRDVTEQKQEESALVHLAFHDPVTELPNRTLLQERLTRAILVAQRHCTELSLAFLDLDRFKDVNDTFGHRCGDGLLRQVAERLASALRESDTVARLGGDEFALLLPGADERGAVLTVRRVLQSLRAPFQIEGHSFNLGASVGVAVYPQHGDNGDALMRRADVAMYAAKRSGGGFAVYSSERDEISSARLLLVAELRQAIEAGQLVLHYQPKVDLKTGRTEQAEALVRWKHPERGIIPPDLFIPLAEDHGLMKPLTAWVLGEALRQQHVWRQAGYPLRVAVNFSARNLHDPDLLDMVTERLTAAHADPSALGIEITESAIMVDPERARETLTVLHNMGISMAIDDFGTGHSSLAYLRQLPFDEIKIDKSFVLDMATNRDDASIVRTIVALGHNFELSVVAEGVDNQRTLDMLAAMHCDIAQGFFLSRPLAPADFTRWLEAPAIELANAG